MKGLNKLALATAVAAAPFATQAMEPMSDDAMGNTTGQAGVTIELQTQVDIDQFSYQQDTAGSFVVDGIAVGGHERDNGEMNSTFDASMDIDLKDNGDALISFGGMNQMVVGQDEESDEPVMGDAPVMLGFDFDRAGLEGEDGAQATLMSDFTMDMYLSHLDITASTDDLADTRDTDAGHLAIDVEFAMEMDVDVDVAAVGLRGVRMAGAERELDDGTELDSTMSLLQDGEVATALNSNPAVVNMTVSAGEPLGAHSDLDQQPDEALVVNLDNFHADMWIDDIRIGRDGVDDVDGGEIGTNRSIGSVGLEGLQVTNTSLAIYGRN